MADDWARVGRLLWGVPGGTSVELVHLKQPLSPVGPLNLVHDHENGYTFVRDREAMAIQLLFEGGEQGVGEDDITIALYGEDDGARGKNRKRTVRMLQGMRDSVERTSGSSGGAAGGGRAGVWRLK